MNQPTLFEQSTQTVEIERVLLFALGEFQSRKKVLTDRELPIDRLRGALKRACEKFETAEISNEAFAESLEKLGAKVTKLQSFVAKHPFRVTVGKDLAEKSFEFYQSELEKEL
jgi:histone H3/H4